MEYGLRRTRLSFNKIIFPVLILVVMEYGLRPFIDNMEPIEL